MNAHVRGGLVRSLALGCVLLALGALPARAQKLDAELVRAIAGGAGELDVIVCLRDDPRHEIRSLGRRPRANRMFSGWRLLRNARETQAGVAAFAAPRARRRVRSHTLANAISTRMAVADVLELARRPEVVRVQLDRKILLPRMPVRLDLFGAPVAPQLGPLATSFTYGLLKIKANQVWSTFGARGAGVRIGNIDTGVDRNHPDIAGKILAFRDFVDGQSLSYDDNGHGTHTAGTHSGGETSGEAIGVAPDSRIIVAKFLPSSGGGSASDALASMDYVTDPDANPGTDDGAHVVSNSWGGDVVDTFAQGAVVNWISLGIFPAFAGGNAGPASGTVGSPGGYPESFCVGATDSDDVVTDFSSRGPFTLGGTPFVRPDVVAPGQDVKSAKHNTTGYVTFSGTSMACPHVAGVVALMFSFNPDLTVAQIKTVLETTAVPLGAPGKDNDYGSGRVDALAAVAAVQPVVKVTAPAPAARFNPGATVTVNWILGAVDVQDASIAQFVVHASTDSGVTYPTLIGTVAGSARTTGWSTPPDTRSGRVRIRVQALKADASIASEDAVDADFSVNQLPSAAAMPVNALVRPGTPVTLSATGSDGDGDGISYSWTQIGGTQSVVITNASQPVAGMTAGTLRGDASVIRLGVFDGYETGTATSTIRVNRLPPVSAGADVRVKPGVIATLSGSGTADPDGFATTYAWSQIDGQSVGALAPVLAPAFTMPGARGTSATFRLSATDNLETGADDAVVRVNQIPIAATSGVTRAKPGVIVAVSGSVSSDPDGDPLTYSWTQLSGPAAFFSPTVINPTVIAPATRGVTLSFRLVASDGLDSSEATAVLKVNRLPVPQASASRAVPPGATFTLSGSAVDPDADPVDFQWTQSSGPTLVFDPSAAMPQVIAPGTRGVTMSFDFQASDGLESASVSGVVVRVNSVPVASAGSAQRLVPDATATLDGSASSDGDGDSLAYAWSQTGGPAVTLSASSAKPTFRVPDARGERLSFQVETSDGIDASQATVTADVNRLAVAQITAPAKTVPGAFVELDAGASSDPDGDALSYRWVQVTGPASGVSPTTARTGFTAPAARGSVMGFVLELSDGVETVKRTVDVKINRLPTPSAGADRAVAPGPVVLDAKASKDEDGDALTFRWKQVAGPEVAIEGAGSALSLDLSGVARGEKLAFALTADDGLEVAETTVKVRVNRAPDAGPNRSLSLVPGTQVSMKPEAEDADGDPLTYRWSQLAGTPVTFNEKASELRFTTPAVGKQSLVFQLVADDGVETDTSRMQVDLTDRAYEADLGAAAGGCRARRSSGEPKDPTFALMLACAALGLLLRTRRIS